MIYLNYRVFSRTADPGPDLDLIQRWGDAGVPSVPCTSSCLALTLIQPKFVSFPPSCICSLESLCSGAFTLFASETVWWCPLFPLHHDIAKPCWPCLATAQPSPPPMLCFCSLESAAVVESTDAVMLSCSEDACLTDRLLVPLVYHSPTQLSLSNSPACVAWSQLSPSRVLCSATATLPTSETGSWCHFLFPAHSHGSTVLASS